MKLFVFLSVILALSLLLQGCGTTQTIPGTTAGKVRSFVTNVEPALRPGARLACALYIDAAVKTQDRAAVIAQIQKISAIIASTNISTSPGALSKSIQAVLPSTLPDAKIFADAIAGGWGLALPYINGDASLLLKVTQDLAGACLEATAAPTS